MTDYKPIREVEFSKSWKKKGSGSYGVYYKMNARKGIKILRQRDTRDYIWKDYEDLLAKAMREFKCLNIAKQTGIVPKAYEVVKVVYKNTFKVGIIMQHIEGTTLKNAPRNFHNWFEKQYGKDYWDASSLLHSRLRNVRLDHDDLHSENIMVKKTKNGFKLYAIDMDPDFIY